jgi:hypothetical protein
MVWLMCGTWKAQGDYEKEAQMSVDTKELRERTGERRFDRLVVPLDHDERNAICDELDALRAALAELRERLKVPNPERDIKNECNDLLKAKDAEIARLRRVAEAGMALRRQHPCTCQVFKGYGIGPCVCNSCSFDVAFAEAEKGEKK